MSDDLVIVKPTAPFYPDGVPAKLKQYNNWILWRYEYVNDKWSKIPITAHSGYKCDITDSSKFASWTAAISAFDTNRAYVDGVGFCLTRNDPFSLIDLDDSSSDPDLATAHEQITYVFSDTYAETSPSGKGVHVLVEGYVDSRRTKGVEVYSADRFMTVTGNSINNLDIKEHQLALSDLVTKIDELRSRGRKNSTVAHISKPETMSDYDVYSRASNAKNGAKFLALYGGDVSSYPGNSEADYALIDIIAFYTDNHDQVARIFYASALGQRNKVRNRYDDYVTPMVKQAYDHRAPEITQQQADAIKANLARMTAEYQESVALADVQSTASLHGTDQVQSTATAEGNGSEPLTAQQEQQAQARAWHNYWSSSNPDNWQLTRPPGLMGDIADYMYDAAQIQVREASVMGAMALMAGICGRAYNTHTRSGLNMYLVYLAGSGTGKDSIGRGMYDIINECERRGMKNAARYIGPDEIGSDKGLLRHMQDESKSFVSIIGEYGKFNKRINPKYPNPNSEGISRILLALYTKSGKGDVLGKTVYSDATKNIKPGSGLALTIFGESVPHSYYETLSEEATADGMTSRFLTLEYKGARNYDNKNQLREVPDRLANNVTALIAMADGANLADNPYIITPNEEAAYILERFSHWTTDTVNGLPEGTSRILWTRAYLKALRLACLLAVGMSHSLANVQLNREALIWAIDFVVNDTKRLVQLSDAGSLGEQDTGGAMEATIMRGLRGYYDNKESYLKELGVTVTMRAHNVVTERFMKRKLLHSNKYYRYLRSADQAKEFKATIESLMVNGIIDRVSEQEKILAEYNSNGTLYKIMDKDAIFKFTAE